MKRFLFTLIFLMSGLIYAFAQQSGSCGENLTWTLDEDGTLTISGTGDMYDYNSDAPWNEATATQLILEEGITHIGVTAFDNCSSLTGTLTLPASLTNIGDKAFRSCGFMGTLILPLELTGIGSGAFDNCSGFTDTLVLPESLLNIGPYAFASCGFSVVLNENKNPITITMDVFENLTFSDTKLCVPAGSGAIYSQAEVWKEFAIEEYGVGITPSFSENGGTVDCGTEISISTKPGAELYYGLGKNAAPTLRYTDPIVVADTTYISAYSRVRNVYSDTVYAKYIPIHETSFSKVDWDWSSEHKATLSLTCSRCRNDIKPAVDLSEELIKEATEEEAGLKTYTATATAYKVTYKNTYREVLPQLKPIHDTIIITDTVYIEVGTGNTVAEAMKVKLYPNPTNGSFTVEAEEDAYLQIYNATGVCIQSNQLQGGRFTGTLPSSGLYFIKLTAKNRTYTKRLVVK